MRLGLLVLLTLASCRTLAAADHPEFSGTWRLSPDQSSSGPSSVVSIEQRANELRISSASQKNDEKTLIACNTIGNDCEAIVDGKPVKVSYYFNGPVLVSWVTEGKKSDRVLKIKRTLSQDGLKMTVEVEQVAPLPEDRETLVYIRDQHVAGTSPN